MFDVLIASAPATTFSGRVSNALRTARLRVIACELGPGDRPSSAFRVDAAVACAESPAAVSSMASGIKVALDGPPPIVGVTRGATLPPAGTVDVLRDDAPAELLIARVERAAATSERRRSKLILSGVLSEVGLRELLASLSNRGRSCIVKVTQDDRRAEFLLEAGQVVHARADGVGSSMAELVIGAVTAWTAAKFEVMGSAASSMVPLAAAAPARPRAPIEGNASDVALAAAVVNAVAGYARAFLSPTTVMRNLESSRSAALSSNGGIDAFSLSEDGIVSVVRVDSARAALPTALAAWCVAFFDECARVLPAKFKRQQIGEVLGGLTRLVEQVGWGAALLRAEAAS